MKVTSYSEVAEKSMMFAVNAVPVPIVYDLEDADGWFSHQERPYVSYKQNENK